MNIILTNRKYLHFTVKFNLSFYLCSLKNLTTFWDCWFHEKRTLWSCLIQQKADEI